jgi:hypothetical protein
MIPHTLTNEKDDWNSGNIDSQNDSQEKKPTFSKAI